MIHWLPKKGKRVQKQESRWEPLGYAKERIAWPVGGPVWGTLVLWLLTGKGSPGATSCAWGCLPVSHTVLSCEQSSCSSSLALDWSLSVLVPVGEGSCPMLYLRMYHLLCCIMWAEDEPAAGWGRVLASPMALHSCFSPWKATCCVPWGWE